MTRVDKVAKSIKSMKVRGARDIAIAAVKCLKELVDDGAGIKELKKAAKMLKAARPSAISLPNAVNYALYLAKKDAYPGKTSKELGRFLDELNRSIEKIAEIGARVIEDGDTILTHCQSDTVVQILKKARKKGKKIKAVCTEARPRHQGYITASMLSAAKIPTTLIIDSAVFHMLRELEVDKVIVGADTVFVDGDVVNKIGSSQIAMSAKKLGIPFIVAAETLKFSPESIMGKMVKIEERDPAEITKIRGVKIRNPAFDITDAEYIDFIITEEGIIPAQEAYHLMREKYGWELKK